MVEAESKCVFCGIAAGQLPAYRIDENELSFAILDIHPISKGHCLVIPKRHVPTWQEMTPEETASAFNLARVVANRLTGLLEPEFVLTFIRGKRVPHTHIFLLPSYPGDLLDAFFTLLEKVSQSAPDLAAFRQAASMEEMAEALREGKWRA
ncbi:MAG: HIT family protein [Chloroflexi bacterium]|nr:HIT family protein [Chloroflexota bacterium]